MELRIGLLYNIMPNIGGGSYWDAGPPAHFLAFVYGVVLGVGVRSDVRERQTSDVGQKHRLMPPPYGGGGIIS